jgi:site-specific DNA-methyltransferase (adenine-specific)
MEREVVGTKQGHGSTSTLSRIKQAEYGYRPEGQPYGDYDGTGTAPITAPATPLAATWDGYGSALKPSWEPVILARKPRRGTYAQTAVEHGTSALWIDGCRVGTEERTYKGGGASNIKLKNHCKGDTGIGYMDGSGKDLEFTATGRWPANVIHDGNHHPFPYTTSGIPSGNRNAAPGYEGGWGSGTPVTGFGDSGSAGRFFHVAKTEEDLIAYLTLMVE